MCLRSVLCAAPADAVLTCPAPLLRETPGRRPASPVHSLGATSMQFGRVPVDKGVCGATWRAVHAVKRVLSSAGCSR